MAEVSAKLVKQLRDKTGAGMMDCKKALTETGGDMEKAVEWLRQKGITSAEKKASKTTAEGLVDSYIHTGGRVGVLVEVNCQTDFVARNEAFKALARDMAMQIAACPNVEYVSVEEIPQEMIAKEKDIEMGREDLASKPENIREKIVDGRIEKRLKELTLMDQPFIKDQSITVEEHIKQTIAQLGENIRVRRFMRFVMGEGIEKEEEDFAAEVAAQAGKAETPAETAPAAAAPAETEVAPAETEVAPAETEATPAETEVAPAATGSEAPSEKKSESKSKSSSSKGGKSSKSKKKK
jgi:elongation factor Ts